MKHYLENLSCAILAVALGMLVGCASTGSTAFEDLNPDSQTEGAPVSRSSVEASASAYRVQRGDTLYGIAFRNGLDYRDLANWNGIVAPYTIYVGQVLKLIPAARRPSRAASQSSTPMVDGVTTQPSVPRKNPLPAPLPSPFEPAQSTASPSTSAGSVTAPALPPNSPEPTPSREIAAASSAADAPAAAKTGLAPPASNQPNSGTGAIAWRWPADGRILTTYVAGDRTRQGIDIAGKAGDPVRAAAAGTVVYSGNGLIGYGELIIVKHSPAFLSAYGHNRMRLVKEGDHVATGQKIAEMGSSSASVDALHFEIRKNGKPVNPLDYLPRR